MQTTGTEAEIAKRIIQRIVDANVGMDFTCPADEEEAEQIVSEEIKRLREQFNEASYQAKQAIVYDMGDGQMRIMKSRWLKIAAALGVTYSRKGGE